MSLFGPDDVIFIQVRFLFLPAPFFFCRSQTHKMVFSTKQIILDIRKGGKGGWANTESYWFFGQNMKMRSKRGEAKNCLSSKNVNLCLLDSLESIVQGIKIL